MFIFIFFPCLFSMYVEHCQGYFIKITLCSRIASHKKKDKRITISMATEKKSAHFLTVFFRLFLHSLCAVIVIIRMLFIWIIICHDKYTKPRYGLNCSNMSSGWKVWKGTSWTGFQSLFYNFYGSSSMAINTVSLPWLLFPFFPYWCLTYKPMISQNIIKGRLWHCELFCIILHKARL